MASFDDMAGFLRGSELFPTEVDNVKEQFELDMREEDVWGLQLEEWEDIVKDTLRDLHGELWSEMKVVELLLGSIIGSLCELGVELDDLATLCPPAASVEFDDMQERESHMKLRSKFEGNSKADRMGAYSCALERGGPQVLQGCCVLSFRAKVGVEVRFGRKEVSRWFRCGLRKG